MGEDNKNCNCGLNDMMNKNCNYTPDGINAAFGYNTQVEMNNSCGCGCNNIE